MTRVWMSSLLSANIGRKQGTRGKLFGRDWDPDGGPIAPDTAEYIAGIHRYMRGFALKREQMTEAAAVSNEAHFSKVGELFAEGGIYVVRSRLAEILSRFDLGEGGLVPFPVYKADLETQYPGEFFLLNFGARKNTLVPEASPDVVKFAVDHRSGQQIWKVESWDGGQVALSSAELIGPDLWFEEILYNKIFMSDALVQALIDAKLEKIWCLTPCTIVEAGP